MPTFSAMIEDGESVEHVREALAHLYDPTILAKLPLSAQLADAGVFRARTSLYDVLLAAIERLKPPGVAPLQSHGWRCYRFLVLRYVECVNHEVIARELGLSARQAYRVHSDALDELSAIVFSDAHPMPWSTKLTESHLVRTSRAERLAREPTATVASNLARAETDLTLVGRQPPEGAVDIVDVARSVQDTLQRIVARQGGQLRLEFPEYLPPVKVTRVCLRQILLNLTLYLVQSIPHGTLILRGAASSTAATISLFSDQDPRIADGGCSPSSPEREASLYAARSLVQLQKIELDEGGFPPRAFHLRIPVGSVHTILLVDDNPDIGDLLRHMLAMTSFRLVHCRTGDRALQLARKNNPEVIILDVVMPTRDGWELLTLLKQDPATTRIPVVVCSVLPDRELALSLDAAAFLPKPVTRKNLLETLSSVTTHPENVVSI